jgi:hypothetical protein
MTVSTDTTAGAVQTYRNVRTHDLQEVTFTQLSLFGVFSFYVKITLLAVYTVFQLGVSHRNTTRNCC